MKNSSIKKTLLQTASGVALACMMAPAAHAVATNVGTATTNSTATAVNDIAFFFNSAGGVLTNTSSIVSAAGGAAVSATGVATATVNNSGTIAAGATAGAAVAGVTTLTNTATGLIVATGPTAVGVSIEGTSAATVSNTSAATIRSEGAGAAIQTAASSTSTITNAGTINNTGSGVAVAVQSGTTSVEIVNSGRIAGTASTPSGTGAWVVPATISIGTNVGSATLTNTGSILGTATGVAVVDVSSAATINNNAGGTIDGDTNAAIRVNAGITGTTAITNASDITSSALSANGGAIDLASSASITNTGTISNTGSGAAIRATDAGVVTITNTGTIANAGSGVAVNVTSINATSGVTAFTLNNNAGGTISGGTVIASTPSGTAVSTGAETAVAIGTGVGSATINNAGTISATLLGANAVYGSSPLTLTNTGTITAGNAAAVFTLGAQTAPTIITNSSSISSASITEGTIDANSSLTLTNNASGVIASTGGRAIDSAVGATITNLGNINTTSGVAVYLAGTATNVVTNSGTITGGATALQTTGTGNTTITNTGTITTSTSVASSAVVLESVVALTNSGTITSSNTGATIVAGPGGATTSITNTGTIQNQQAGIALDINNTIGQITNSGVISTVGATAIDIAAGATVTSGISNSGTIRGATNSFNNGGNAITFTNTGTMVGNVVLSNAGADIFNVNGGVITGTITGNGANDTLNFNAANGFTTGGNIASVQTINVDGGSVTLNHTITGANAVVVDAGATLNQNAAITSTTGTINGILDVDGVTTTNATQTFTGNLTVGAGGRVVVGATDGGANDLLNVVGNAVLTDGATVFLETGTAQISNGDTFQVIDSTGMTATPGNLNLTSSNNFITLTGNVAANNLTLTATTASTASGVSNLLTNNGITNTASLVNFAGGSTGGANTVAATTSLSSYLTALQATDQVTFQAINGRINGLSGQALADALEELTPNSAVIGGSTAAVIGGTNAVGNVVVARLDQARQQQFARNESGLAAGDMYANDLQLWAQPYGTAVNQGVRNGIDGYDADVYGLLVGGDVQVMDQVRLGLSLGYSDTNVVARGSNGLDGSDIEGYNVNLYGSYTEGAFFVDALLGAGWSDYETSRFVTLGNAVAKGDFDGNTYSARVGAGYDLDAGSGFTVTPNASVSYTYLETDSYAETGGGGLGANVGELENDSLITSIGAKVAYDHETSMGTFVPYVEANWLNENGDDDQTITSSFIGGGQTFVTKSAGIERDAIQLGTGLDFYTDSNTKLGVHVDFLDRDDVKVLSGALRVRMPF